jgi:hypothetical protein
MSGQEAVMHIHIDWDGPYTLAATKKLTGPTDFGVYQIYGGHPVYGSSALLYIGRAELQKFATRISQEEEWQYNRDAQRIEVYVGRLSRSQTLDGDTWNKYIRWAERLLISAHSPPYNQQLSLGELEPQLRSVHILNWGCHRDLLPEVSGARWTTLFVGFDESQHYSEEE